LTADAFELAVLVAGGLHGRVLLDPGDPHLSAARNTQHGTHQLQLGEQGRSRESEPPDERNQAGEQKKIIHESRHANPLCGLTLDDEPFHTPRPQRTAAT
jgi:hypothetical protein